MRGKVAILDLRGCATAWTAVADELEGPRASGVVNAVVVAVDGATDVAGVDPAELADLALFELPVVVALVGEVHGTAAAIALAGDIRVCDQSLRLSVPSMAERLSLLIGKEAASHAAAAPLGADDALAWGLVSRVATGEESAVDVACETATVIAGRGPVATRLGKEAVWRGLAMPLEQALRFETDLTLLLQTTKDRAEGVRAFLEKRAPIFEGD